METIAKHRHARSSAQKVRLVADLIRGKKVSQALDILTYTNKKAAVLVKKVLAFNGDVQVETFSSLKKQGVDKLRQKLDTWFSEMQPVEETQDGE